MKHEIRYAPYDGGMKRECSCSNPDAHHVERGAFEAWARGSGKVNITRTVQRPQGEIAYAFPPGRAAWAAWLERSGRN
jgi:hypothetical protein